MSVLFGANLPTNKTPAYTGLQIQTSVNTLPIPVVWGTVKIAPNVGWYGDFTKHNKSVSAGGKGGGKGAEIADYTASVELMLCEGVVDSVPKVFVDQGTSTLAELGMTLIPGTYPEQAPWSYLEHAHPEDAFGYPGTAIIVIENYDLGPSAALPQHNVLCVRTTGFEASWCAPSGIATADMALVIQDFLSSEQYGVPGFANSFDTDTLLSTDAATTTGDASLQTYLRALGIGMGVALTSQETASSILDRWLQLCNCAAVWSGEKLKFIPYGDETITANGVTYLPDLAAVVDLSADDFLEQSGDAPFSVSRTDPAEAKNVVNLEITSEDGNFSYLPIPAWDQSAIENALTRRIDSTVTAHEIIGTEVGAIIAHLILQKGLYNRNSATFKLPVTFCPYDPMDNVTVAVPLLEYAQASFRIVSIEEDDQGDLTVDIDELRLGTGTAVRYEKEKSSGTAHNSRAPASAVNTPIIFEPSSLLVGSPEIWIGVCGGGGDYDPNWGGCQVHLSVDDDVYEHVDNITNTCRMGVITGSLASFGGANPDTSHTLSVDLTQSHGRVRSGSADDAENGRTLCYVDGELLSYETATLSIATASAEPHNIPAVAPYEIAVNHDSTFDSDGGVSFHGGAALTFVGSHPGPSEYTEDGEGLYTFNAADAGAAVDITYDYANSHHFVLSNLWRGQYGTKAAAHSSGTQFARLDGTIFKFPLPIEYIGKLIYVKLVSVNIFGLGLEDISTVTAYEYTPTGKWPPPQDMIGFAVEAVTITGAGGRQRATLHLTWALVDGDGYPILNVDHVRYQVRLAADDSNVARGRSDFDDGTETLGHNIMPGTVYEVRAKYRANGFRDTVTNWTDWLPVSTSTAAEVVPGDLETDPPAAPTFGGAPITSSVSIDMKTGLPVITEKFTWNANSESDIGAYVAEILIDGVWEHVAKTRKGRTWAQTTVEANVAYSWRVMAVDRLGNESDWSATAGPYTSTYDSVAPAAPTALAGTSGATSVALTWTNPSDDDLDKIEIWETPTNASPDPVADIAYRINVLQGHKVAKGAYTRGAMATGSSKYYRLRAIDKSGNVSAFTAAAGPYGPALVTVDDLDATAPATPTFGGSPFTSAGGADPKTGLPVVFVTFTWNANSEADLGSYGIMVQEGSGSFEHRGRVDSDSTSFTFPTKSNTAYSAKVRAIDRLGNKSAFSSVAGPYTSTYDATAPSAPTWVSITGKLHHVSLRWLNSSDADLTLIEIWETPTNVAPDPVADATNYLIATVPARIGKRQSHPRGGLASGASNYYWLRSIDNSGNASAFSSSSLGSTAQVVNADVTDNTLAGGKLLDGDTWTKTLHLGEAGRLFIDGPNARITANDGTFDRAQFGKFGSGDYGFKIWDSDGTLVFRSDSSGTLISGFKIGADYIRDAANSFGLASTVTGADDVRFWAGASFANRGIATFRLYESGLLFATGATISGAITATSGAIGGFGIDTTKISSSGGEIVIDSSNKRLDVFQADGTTLRVRVGKFASGDYGIKVWDTHGNLILALTDGATSFDGAAITAGTVVLGKLADMTGPAVLGKASGTGAPAAISTATDGQILRRSGGSLGFGSIDLSASAAVGTSILAGANGGTNNAFMQFSGPATSLKTYTLPNTSDTIACLGSAQTFSADQTFTGKAIVPSDGTFRFDDPNSSFFWLLKIGTDGTALTANKDINVPIKQNANTTLAAISDVGDQTFLGNIFFNGTLKILASGANYLNIIPVLDANRALTLDLTGGGSTFTLAGKNLTLTANATLGGTSSGNNTGDQTITLTGDVTGSGTGSFAATIGANKVTLAKMATIAASRFIGGAADAADPATPTALNPTQARTILGIFPNRVNADFDVTSSTTMADVTGLTQAILAGVRYGFRAVLHFDANASGGYKFDISAGQPTPSALTATNIIYNVQVFLDSGTFTGSRKTALDTAFGSTTAGPGVAIIWGELLVGVAGTISVAFAQNASFGTKSTIKRGSTFDVWEIP